MEKKTAHKEEKRKVAEEETTPRIADTSETKT